MRIALFAALIACSSSSKAPETPTTPTTTEPAASITGPLSEAEFKAMHEPSPAPSTYEKQGTHVALAGGSKAYLSLPKGTGPFPAIVVIHEWWGKNDHIEHWADRLATAGWAALAVDLYGGQVATDRDTAMKLVKGVDEAKAAATISAGLAFLADDPRVKATKRAAIGWCFGGGWSFKTALAHPELTGAIMYYGGFETDAAKLSAIKAKLLGVFATRDKGIPNEEVDKLEAGLKQAGVDAKILRYDAEHAFANPSNQIYDEKAAADAWSHVLAFLGSL